VKSKPAALAVAAITLAALAACGSGSHESYITPSAYGENGHCYWIDDPAEVTALMAAGDCPVNWTPMRAPSAWEAMYYGYYSSTFYSSHYVVASHRSVYVTHVHTFQKQNTTLIQTQKTVLTRQLKSSSSSSTRTRDYSSVPNSRTASTRTTSPTPKRTTTRITGRR
jgi:hypothetical protein